MTPTTTLVRTLWGYLLLQITLADMEEKVWLPGATGSGPFDVALAWATAFVANFPEADVTLTSVGSGSAQQALWGDIDCENKPVDAICTHDVVTESVWGMGDAPIKASVYEEQPLVQMQQFPACAGAIAIVHSNEVLQGQEGVLRMTFDVISGVFNTTIEYWDDPLIQEMNPNMTLPHERISAVVRSDSSGQTSIVTDSLGYQVPSWPEEAVGKLPEWPLGELVHPRELTQSCSDGNASDVPYSFAADGKNGISLGMLRVPYSIGYMEMGFVGSLTDFLSQVNIGKAGDVDSFVGPNADSLRATMGGLANELSTDTLELNLATADTPTGGYPISGYAYWYLKKNHTEFDSCYQAWLVCKFVEWSYTNEQAADLAIQNGWVVPPKSVVNIALERLKDVQCLDTESGRVISALSYVPHKYRTSNEVDAVVVATATAAAFVVTLALLWNFYDRRRKRGDHIWKVSKDELKFGSPPEIIGRGSFGLVLLADYRGTQVAVKRVTPPNRDSDSKKKNKVKPNPMFDSVDDSGDTSDTDMVPADVFQSGTTKSSSSYNSRQQMVSSSVDAMASTQLQGQGTGQVSNTLSRKEFIEEMRIIAKLRHPCITTMMGAVLDRREEPMLVMEYMEHGSFYDLLHNDTMVLDGDLLIPILQDISQGIRFLHSANPAVIHGDLKAKNILVDRKFRAKVADFGLAQKAKLEGGACGTPYWMAPELLSGRSSNTCASDIYSFGIILYEAYARKDPYLGEVQSQVLQDIMNPKTNKRPPVPHNMPSSVQSVMIDCLNSNALGRPPADELDGRMKRISNDHTDGDKPLRAKSSNLSLFDIFPRHVAEALRDGRTVEPEHKECVTIFFSDIVGFTDMSARLDPRKVAALLDRLYNTFDDLSTKFEVFKVETIGDAYMAVTNLVKDQQEDHAKRIAMFAIDAVEAANKTLIDPDDPGLGFVNIRVGFHSGPVVADVVGNRNPRYCLFGDSVNTASRMESMSEQNRIHCSKRAHDLLKAQMPELPMALRGAMKVKGKGEMTTYWVNEVPTSRPRRNKHMTMLGMVTEMDESERRMSSGSLDLSESLREDSLRHSSNGSKRQSSRDKRKSSSKGNKLAGVLNKFLKSQNNVHTGDPDGSPRSRKSAVKVRNTTSPLPKVDDMV